MKKRLSSLGRILLVRKVVRLPFCFTDVIYFLETCFVVYNIISNDEEWLQTDVKVEYLNKRRRTRAHILCTFNLGFL